MTGPEVPRQRQRGPEMRQYRYTPAERHELFLAVRDRITKVQDEERGQGRARRLYMLRQLLDKLADR